MNYGSSGVGTSSISSAVMFEQATGTKMTHVPYKSTGDVVNSMLGGHIDLAIDSMTTVWPHAKQGTVRALGVSTPQRSAIGAGRAGHRRDRQGLRGDRLAGPVRAGRHAEADRRARSRPRPSASGICRTVKEQLDDVGADSAPSESPEAFMAFTRAERMKWAEVVKAAGVKIE